MKMDSKTLFSKVTPLKLFFIAAIPGMVSMFASSIYSTLEGMFIGQYLGGTAFAAVNLVMPLVLINFSLADLIGVGSSVSISIYLGKKEDKSANNVFTSSIILIFAAAILMGIFMFFASPTILRLMGATGETAELAVRYIRAYALCGPFCTIVFAMDNYLRISGIIRGSMFLNIFMSFLTIVLLFVFIVICKMSVVGSALATCTSMFVSAIIALLPFLRGKTVLKFCKPRFSASMVKKIIICGSPTFLNNVAGRLTSIVMNVVLLRMGGEMAVAAYGVLMYSSDLIQPCLYGMNDSLQPAIGYNWGAKAYDRVKAIAKCVFTASAIASCIATAAMFFLSTPIASLFVDANEPGLLEMSSNALKLFCFAYLIRWFSFSAQGFFSAIEKPLPASILSVSSALVFPIIIIIVLLPLGLNGIWLNMTGTAILTGLLALFMLKKMQKKMKAETNKVPSETL